MLTLPHGMFTYWGAGMRYLAEKERGIENCKVWHILDKCSTAPKRLSTTSSASSAARRSHTVWNKM